ncbi:MAG TPA: hypothetical protein VKB88_13770 [Bryobacteraceae bacterium]|nr:hypothetical protein [Bryobacteraceae bacterium]
MTPMIYRHLNIGLTAAQLRLLDKLAKKLHLDRTNALRYCIVRTAELEKLK